MKHPATRELFNYWNDLRGERAAPERGEIDPAAIRNVLADTFMLDVDLAQRFPFRLAGTRVNGLFDADQKGRSFLGLWRVEERRNIAAVLLAVADGACPVVAGAVAAPPGQSECMFELLFLPLRHHGKTHTRLLGIVTAAARPAWIDLLPIGTLMLRSLRILDGEENETKPARMAVGQGRTGHNASRTIDAFMAGAPALIPSPPESSSSRPYLRLIQGGR